MAVYLLVVLEYIDTADPGSSDDILCISGAVDNPGLVDGLVHALLFRDTAMVCKWFGDETWT